MANVYKLWDTERPAFLAMKIIHESLAENDRIKIGESIFVIKLQDENLKRTAHGGAKKSRKAAG